MSKKTSNVDAKVRQLLEHLESSTPPKSAKFGVCDSNGLFGGLVLTHGGKTWAYEVRAVRDVSGCRGTGWTTHAHALVHALGKAGALTKAEVQEWLVLQEEAEDRRRAHDELERLRRDANRLGFKLTKVRTRRQAKDPK